MKGKSNKKKKGSPDRRPFFNPAADKFKGIHKSAKRGYYTSKKTGKKIAYYVNEKGKRISKIEWAQFITVKKEFSVKRQKRKTPIVFPLSPFHHKSFLSFVKNKMFDDGYVILILDGSTPYKKFSKIGSYEFFSTVRAFYYANVTQQKKKSDDMIWRCVLDKANKEILQSSKDIRTLHLKNSELTPLLLFL